MSKSKGKARHILWCDTEGGVRNVNLWDITFIEETPDSVRAQRFISVSDATKRGRSQLRSLLPAKLYNSVAKSGYACTVSYSCNNNGTWKPLEYACSGTFLPKLLIPYLDSKAGSVLVAWNMRGHDKHVLTRAVGRPVLDKLIMWDSLPWFRSKYGLPKNSMSSASAGTPRSVFKVPNHGTAHSSFADAAHMRDVVRRGAYCLCQGDQTNLDAYKFATRKEQFNSVCKEVEDELLAAEWCEVTDCAWAPGNMPESIYKTVST